jgi:carbonic anhydrase
VPSPDPLPGDLLDGYRRFRAQRLPAERERYRRLAEGGQRPPTMVVACVDSRSGPEIVFDAGPGEMFIVRNVAGLVPVYTPDNRFGSVVAAALDEHRPLSSTDFVGAWISGLRDLADELDPSDWADPARYVRALEYRSVEQSLVNLGTFPWIRSRVRGGSLTLAGAWFDIAIGELHELTESGWRPVG